MIDIPDNYMRTTKQIRYMLDLEDAGFAFDFIGNGMGTAPLPSKQIIGMDKLIPIVPKWTIKSFGVPHAYEHYLMPNGKVGTGSEGAAFWDSEDDMCFIMYGPKEDSDESIEVWAHSLDTMPEFRTSQPPTMCKHPWVKYRMTVDKEGS